MLIFPPLLLFLSSQISACGKPLRLAILTVCLLAVLSQVSARPSDVTKPVEMISSSSSSSPASTVLSHNQKRRSAEVHPDEDYDDEVDYERVKRCHEDVSWLC